VDPSVTLAAAIAVAVVAVCFWLISLARRDASIADVAWGLIFTTVAWVSLAVGEGGPAMLLAALLTSLWGVRLAVHIGRRNLGHGEDRRYTAMRDRRPEKFWIWSLFGVFLLQGLLALIVSLPLQSLGAGAGQDIGMASWLGLAIFLAGFAFEAIGDAQLNAFKRDPDSGDRVMDRGLWRFTRHPNYFGDAVLWWGLWLLAVESGAGWWTVIGPALMTFLLLRVSGVSMLEADISGRRPGYADYVRRTNAFIPGRPHG
jgi:steroid 5-alpha reductase family enzyme